MSDDYLNKPLSISGDNYGAAPGNDQILNQRKPEILNFLFFSAPSKAVPSFTSPYLNYDPRYMRQAQPEFIFPEGASKQRGRFELAFSLIGSSVMVGAAIGGAGGMYNGIRASNIAQQTGKLRRTQILNHIMKQGAGTGKYNKLSETLLATYHFMVIFLANTFGTAAVMYSAFGVLLSWARGGDDDEINTIAAGTATGLFYKSTAGLRKCAIGGGVGLLLSSAYVLWNMSGSKYSKQYM